MNAKFDALEKLKNNNWKEEEKKTRKFTKKSKAKVLLVSSYANIFQCHGLFVTITCQTFLLIKSMVKCINPLLVLPVDLPGVFPRER